MDGELVPRADPSRPTRDIPPVQHEPTLAKDREELRVSGAEVAQECPDGHARGRERPSQLGRSHGLSSRSEQEDSRPHGHGQPNPVPL